MIRHILTATALIIPLTVSGCDFGHAPPGWSDDWNLNNVRVDESRLTGEMGGFSFDAVGELSGGREAGGLMKLGVWVGAEHNAISGDTGMNALAIWGDMDSLAKDETHVFRSRSTNPMPFHANANDHRVSQTDVYIETLGCAGFIAVGEWHYDSVAETTEVTITRDEANSRDIVTYEAKFPSGDFTRGTFAIPDEGPLGKVNLLW